MSDVTIVMNLGNFASLTALAPTIAMLDTFSPNVRWYALRPANRPVTPPPAADDPLADYKARRKRARDQWAALEFRRDCERLGLDPSVTPTGIDASAANLGLQFLADQGVDPLSFVEAVLKRGFVERQSVATVDDITDLVGHEAFTQFAARSGEARLEEIENELAEALIYAGPAFIVEGEAFIGRQHFPLMRWLLGGRNGTPPV